MNHLSGKECLFKIWGCTKREGEKDFFGYRDPEVRGEFVQLFSRNNAEGNGEISAVILYDGKLHECPLNMVKF